MPVRPTEAGSVMFYQVTARITKVPGLAASTIICEYACSLDAASYQAIANHKNSIVDCRLSSWEIVWLCPAGESRLTRLRSNPLLCRRCFSLSTGRWYTFVPNCFCAGFRNFSRLKSERLQPVGCNLLNNGAEEGTRTLTGLAHYPLKIACLPIPPPRREECVYTESSWQASLFLSGRSSRFGRRAYSGRGERIARRSAFFPVAESCGADFPYRAAALRGAER